MAQALPDSPCALPLLGPVPPALADKMRRLQALLDRQAKAIRRAR